MASAIPAASVRGTRTSALEGGAFENSAVMLRGHKWPIRWSKPFMKCQIFSCKFPASVRPSAPYKPHLI